MTAMQLLLVGKAPITTFATWNPADAGSNVLLTGGNLSVAFTGSTNTVVRATIGQSSGKWYWEWLSTGSTGASNGFVGIANSSYTVSTNELGLTANSWGYKGFDGNKVTNGSASAYGNNWGNGNLIMTALDMDNGKVWWGKDGVWQNSGDPAAGTNPAFTGISGTIFPAYAANATAWTGTANFGASALSFTPPAGFNSGFGN